MQQYDYSTLRNKHNSEQTHEVPSEKKQIFYHKTMDDWWENGL